MAASLWPWLLVAAAGALHGANPVSGWVAAAWCGSAKGRGPALRALGSIAAGHLASIAVVAAAVPLALRAGLVFEPRWLQGLGLVLLLALGLDHLRRGHGRARRPAGRTALALWSFIVGTARGSSWMLVPALVPFCTGEMPAREITAAGSMGLALAAVGVHLAAMLGTMAALAGGVRRLARRLEFAQGIRADSPIQDARASKFCS